MADDIAITPGTGVNVATDEVGDKHYQLIKPVHGPADSVPTHTSAVAPLPVADAGAAAGLTDLETAVAALLAAQGTGNGLLEDLIAASGGQAAEVKHAKIDFTAEGDNTIVAGVALKKIRVLAYHFTLAGAGTLRWKSAATAISGPMNFPALGGMVVNGGGGAVPVISTAVGEALVLNADWPTGITSIATGGVVSYIEE